jgi:hypothetical protein
MTDLDSWVESLEAELGLPPGTIDVPAVLDLARDAAHAVARPAAPVTTYAVGFAAGLAAASGIAASASGEPDAAEKASGLAARWVAG